MVANHQATTAAGATPSDQATADPGAVDNGVAQLPPTTLAPVAVSDDESSGDDGESGGATAPVVQAPVPPAVALLSSHPPIVQQQTAGYGSPAPSSRSNRASSRTSGS